MFSIGQTNKFNQKLGLGDAAGWAEIAVGRFVHSSQIRVKSKNHYTLERIANEILEGSSTRARASTRWSYSL
jgi:hypothetical protein